MNILLGSPEQPVSERINASGSGLVLIAIIMLALFPAFALDTIRFSNRFVGPIARLRRYMRELAAGEPINALTFRDNDFWGDVADEFNVIALKVKDQASEIESLKEQLAQSSKATV